MNVSRDLKEKISKLKFINAIKSNKNFEHYGMRGVREENKKKSKSVGRKGTLLIKEENSYLYNELEIPSSEKCF